MSWIADDGDSGREWFATEREAIEAAQAIEGTAWVIRGYRELEDGVVDLTSYTVLHFDHGRELSEAEATESGAVRPI